MADLSGVGSTAGTAIGNAILPGIGGVLGGIAGSLFGGLFGGGQANKGYEQAIGAMQQAYQPIIDQTKGSISDYSRLLGGLGQGYQESPGLTAQLGLLNQKLAAMGTGRSPASVGASYAPLVSQDYQNFYGRQLSQLGAYQPLMSMYYGASGALGSGLANLYTQKGATGQATDVQNAQWGMKNFGFDITNALQGLFSGQSGGSASPGYTVMNAPGIQPGQGVSGFLPSYTPKWSAE